MPSTINPTNHTPRRFRRCAVAGKSVTSDVAVIVVLLIGLIVAGATDCCAQLAADDLGASGPPALPDDPAAVIAVVGQSPILWGDVQPKVDGRIRQALEQTKQEMPPDQLAIARAQLTRLALKEAIQTKMMSECFLLEQVGTQAAEKRSEVSEMMHSRARQMFFENEVEKLKEQYKTEDLTELNAILSEKGLSLQARQREFTDMMLGHMYMRSKVEQDPKVTIAEINSRYARDLNRYRHGAKARWEQLSVLFENHPSREAARAAIVAMGNEAYYGNMKAVAKEKSEEPFASDGGQHDWTTQGSLASKPLDEQLFSIPLDKISDVIEDDQGLHLIRVIERSSPGVQPLAELQDQIREQLKQEKISAAQAEMVKQMTKRVPVWTLFPQDVPDAKPLQVTRETVQPVSRSGGRVPLNR
ncbi:peptidylprolyl isomerase [Stieleria sp. TO1_6]|uniref:peptidylprolyl isomerase n=1 Tax=Stieleria tagensis TaxID=2956795 RepID=UPI00209A9F70|nr:peptidyl-prolyl cis-trans isomerase [Stieleria tagensis]MCO8122256.1 peptidylprolyl isomerase [Stieleria tagensis]